MLKNAAEFKMEFEELKIEIPVTKDSEDDEEENLSSVVERRYENKAAGNFVTGFDVNSEECKERKLRRAKRFGLKFGLEKDADSDNKNDTNNSEKTLMRMISELPKIPEAEARPDAVLLYGLDEMSTSDIFSYLADFAPGAVEWIDDSSCNVVWDDNHTAARVLSAFGRPLQQPDTNNEEEEEEEEEMSTDENSKPNWLIATKSHAKADQLFLRQSTKKDKKQLGASKRSLYYLVHGNPNKEGQKGRKGKKRGLVSSSRKRKIALEKEKARQKSSGEPEIDFVEQMEIEENDGPQLPPLKVMVTNDVREEDKAPLRMRMYADDEIEDLNDDKEEKVEEHTEKGDKKNHWKSRNLPKGKPIDLRKKLQGRRYGFGGGNMPTLSIEIREEPAS